MAIITRQGKGEILTHGEVDGNFTELDSRLTTLESQPVVSGGLELETKIYASSAPSYSYYTTEYICEPNNTWVLAQDKKAEGFEIHNVTPTDGWFSEIIFGINGHEFPVFNSTGMDFIVVGGDSSDGILKLIVSAPDASEASTFIGYKEAIANGEMTLEDFQDLVYNASFSYENDAALATEVINWINNTLTDKTQFLLNTSSIFKEMTYFPELLVDSVYSKNTTTNNLTAGVTSISSGTVSGNFSVAGSIAQNNAFASGESSSTGWNSFATGQATASQTNSAAFSKGEAAAYGSFAFGPSSLCNAQNSMSLGTSSKVGYNATNSFAMGYSTEIANSSMYSFAIGNFAYVQGNNSVSIGTTTKVNASNSYSLGYRTRVAENYVFGMGYGTTIPSSTGTTNENLTIKFDYKNGNGYFDGAADVSAADYAEYFESLSGTAIERGLFVSFSEGSEKIEVGDADIIGIISPLPGIVGDSASLNWQGKYKTDAYGVRIKEEKLITDKLSISYDEVKKTETEIKEILTNKSIKELKGIKGIKKYKLNVVIEDNYKSFEIKFDDTVITDKSDLEKEYFISDISTLSGTYTAVREEFVLNPDYNADKTYIPRSERPEWNCVGLLGKLWVQTDDKSIKTGDYVTSDTNGKAIKSTKGNTNSYRVMTTNHDNGIVRIFFK